jgi:tetratricopeptide (TPR) repeat protein
VLALSVAACGNGSEAKAPVLPAVNTAAVRDMAKAVEAAKDPDGRPRAVSLLEKAVTTDEHLWEAHYNLGVLLAESGDLAKAQKHLKRAAELAPNAEDVAVALGEVQRRASEPKAAAKALSEFVKRYPNALVARTVLVGALRESGQIEEALAEAREVLVRRPKDANALAELSLTYLEQDEVDTAELLVQEALKGEPNAVAERTAGLVALRRGDDALAFRHFARASSLDPKDTTARLNVGTVLLKAGVYKKAEQEFRAVLEVEPDAEQALLGLAAAVRGQGSRDNTAPFSEAERLLKQILESKPNHQAALFNLAVLYANFTGQPEKARPLLQRFLEAASSEHPAHADAEALLGRLSSTKK